MADTLRVGLSCAVRIDTLHAQSLAFRVAVTDVVRPAAKAWARLA